MEETRRGPVIGETYTGFLQLLNGGVTPSERVVVHNENLRRLEDYRLLAVQQRKFVQKIGEEEGKRQ